MENGIRIRKIIFEQLMKEDGNRKNWEMLCSSDKPLVPFIGAGISAWCYPTWNDLLIKTVEEKFSEPCAEIVRRALECKGTPNIEDDEKKKNFHWMEEIAECIFDENSESYNSYKNKYKIIDDKEQIQNNANTVLQQLRDNVGEESVNKKREAVNALYDAFGSTKLKEKGKMPEYQNFFHRIFSDILVTTNYDKALERCYTSLFSYSYMDLNSSTDTEKSWLFKAIEAKLRQRQNELDGKRKEMVNIPVPDIPILLKLHGSVEHANQIALAASGYEKVYRKEMRDVLKLIYQKSTLIFLGSGLREDRFLDEFINCRKERRCQHFTFLPVPEEKDEQKKRREELEGTFGIYPIFYDQEDLEGLFTDPAEREQVFHDYFLGILLENLSRRKMYYPQPLELLWDRYRFKTMSLNECLANIRKRTLMQRAPKYVRRKEALQIWKLLNSSDECPLIAIIGNTGSGRSTLCLCIQDLNRNYKDTMQFFYIPLVHCKSWDEFCFRLYQDMNIVARDIPKPEEWRKVAEQVARRCGGYWRSILILDQLDELKDTDNNYQVWNIIKKILRYWKSHQTRVIFTCHDYPEELSCYTWRIGELKNEEARTVFFSACTSKRYRNISFLEQKVVSELFNRQAFQPASAYLLGKYANSKSDLNGLMEEWELYHQAGDKEGQILARILWNHLLEEHRYGEQSKEKKTLIEENILWIWGILGTYPGIFPSVFFENVLSDNSFIQSKELSEKTLLFMKNAGLCEESGDEKKSILLKNIVFCAKKYFLEKLEENSKSEADGNDNQKPGEDNRFAGLVRNFENDLNESEKKYYGQTCFRGYLMEDYNGKLRKYVLRELKGGDSKKEAADDVLDILDCLGKQVENDKKRMLNKKLNLVLRYEIKTVIRFLCNCLSRQDITAAKQKQIAQIGFRFAHYFHYIPNTAIPLIRQLLEIMEESEQRCLYKLASLKRVMGDIMRLTGRKKEAADYYQDSLHLCNEQMLVAFEGKHRDHEEIYRESRRIKAGVLLISNDYYGLCSQIGTPYDPYQIYIEIEDLWGQAYYNQCMGEMLFREAAKKTKYGFSEERKSYFDKISNYYNRSAEIFNKVEDKTGMAYILKCMGDLIEKFNDVYKKEGGYFKQEGIGNKCYQIKKDETKKIEDDDWIYDVACCYTQAFIYYYGHINWRGFANVLQAMGTAYRETLIVKNKEIDCVEKLYGLAEECYRWLGDMRGLADTLDYFGYGYQDCREDRYQYMALSKWMESREIWKSQGNDVKAEEIDKVIRNLREKLQNRTGGENGKTGNE